LMRPKVTIGVCVKNGASYIGDAINSIINQSFPLQLMEVVFVDDGSTDRTLPIIESYVPKMNIQVKIFHHQWKGLGYSRNVVINNANGEYIIWVDADMILPENFVTMQVEFMDKNSDVGIAKGRYGIQSTTSLVAYLQNIEDVVESLDCEQKPLYKPLGTGGSIYRVEAIRQVGGFDENIMGVGEDMDVEYRVRTSGWLLKTTTAEFYEKRRKKWKDLWNEYFWHGSGGRTIFNKVSPHSMLYKMFPPTIILIVVSRSCNAYKLVHKKVVFLLPLHWIFKRIAWCLGFVLSM
jgi:glycosyltransferase involved in cell wall biosynthesis